MDLKENSSVNLTESVVNVTENTKPGIVLPIPWVDKILGTLMLFILVFGLFANVNSFR